MKFHHVGIACEDIAETIRFIRSTYKVFRTSEIIYDPNQDATVCLVSVEDGLNIELISGKQVDGLLRRGISLYHTCFEVEDLEATLDSFSREGARTISPPRSAVLFGGREVAFMMTPTGIVEFIGPESGLRN